MAASSKHHAKSVRACVCTYTTRTHKYVMYVRARVCLYMCMYVSHTYYHEFLEVSPDVQIHDVQTLKVEYSRVEVEVQ